LGLLAAGGIAPEPHPEVTVLRRVNHRLFAHELGGGLPHQQYLRERAPIEALLRRAERPWLLKRPLAFAGRGQLRFYGPISDKQWSWLDVSLEQDGVIVEPLVSPKLELSLHGFVWPGGRFELGRICVQQVSERGVFRGVRLAEAGELSPAESEGLFAQGERVAHALHGAGYFGPFGLDAYRYEAEGKIGFCALSEINARYTMGFVTGFPRHPSTLLLT
jgi:phosphoribosylaminoimidazole carboxylase (NCAIR synthetase)